MLTYEKGRCVGGWLWPVALVLLTLFACVPLARGQVNGVVESVGFDQTFRPGTWTPLTVRLRPDAGASGTYQIRIEQEDLDRDLVSFVRTITLTAPSAGGGAGSDQRFVVYFLPQGARNRNGRGLPDRTQGSRLDQLDEELRVFLCDAQGRKLARIPVGSMVASLEPPDVSPRRFAKLVLYVRETGSSPARQEFLANPSPLMGVTEDVAFVEVSPRTLPTSALGYEAVDTVVWAAGSPPDRASASEEPRYRALREWVGRGGRLVVMQHGEWRRTAAWGDLLPVTFPRFGEVQGATTRVDLRTLIELASPFDTPEQRTAWLTLRGPHTYGVAVAKPGVVVEQELEWAGLVPGLPERSVWLARHGVGAGSVTYVAQDLGSPQLSPAQPPTGWARVWCRVLDYRYAPLVAEKGMPDDLKEQVQPARSAYDLGQMVKGRMELAARAGVLVGLAVLFFVLYWVAAGPGAWVVLKLKGKREYAWLAFAAVACGATLVTLLVVRVVLRGSPELRHFSLVRVMPGEPTLVESRLGLYIPRDGDQRVSLPAGSAEHASVVAPYAIHPYHAIDASEFPAFRRYEVGVPDVAGDRAASAEVPYRSTEKRLQTTWRGELKATGADTPLALSGRPAIAPPGKMNLLDGTLTNATGTDLRNVFLVFRAERQPNPGQDRVVFLPSWKDGTQLALADLTNTGPDGRAKRIGLPTGKGDGSNWGVDSGEVVWGLIALPGRDNADEMSGWVRARVGAATLMLEDLSFDDSNLPTPRGYFALSFFDRLPFFRSVGGYNRAEMLRPNARFLDVSGAVSGGRLVVLAQLDNAPLPVPLDVEGEIVRGTGTTLFQFVLPLDRTNDRLSDEEDEAATRPTTAPANATPAPSLMP